MSKELFHRILERLDQGGKIPDTNGDYWAVCPWHGDSKASLSIHPEKGWFCFGCNEGGSLKALAVKLGLEAAPQDTTRAPRLSDAEATAALAERGLRQETIEAKGILPDYENQAWAYPVRDASGHRVGVRWKAYPGRQGHKYWQPKGQGRLLYGLEDIAGQEEVWFCPGEPDTWAFSQAGIPAFCSTGSEVAALPKGTMEILRVLEVKTIHAYGDLDRAGQKGVNQAARAFREGGFEVLVHQLPQELGEGGDGNDLYLWHECDDGAFREALQGLPIMPPGSESVSEPLPEIIITGRALQEKREPAVRAMEAANDPPTIFVRGRLLTRIGKDEDGMPVIEAMSESALRNYMADRAHFIRLTKTRKNIASSKLDPPLAVVRAVGALGEWPFPALQGITQVPIIRPDGTVTLTPGYDPATRLFYSPPAGLHVPEVPHHPTAEQLAAATTLLKETICDFPFEDQVSHANALGAILTLALRPMIGGYVPMALFDKPQPGTGATLLAQVAALIGTGGQAAMMSAPRTDQEWHKRITALLLQGRTIVVVDNVERRLFSESLGSLLTTAFWEDRLLGKSQMVRLAHRTTWIVTGNNIQLAGALPRRCYWVRLDAQMARPWQRTEFKHRHLLEWIARNQGGILAAIFTLARAWIAVGRPKVPNLPVFGSYEEWADTIGGILHHAGIEHFLDNLERMYDQADVETSEWEAFLIAWHGAYGDQKLTLAEFTLGLPEHKDLENSLPGTLAEAWINPKQSFGRRLGNALSRKNQMRFPCGLYIQKGETARTRGRLWSVRQHRTQIGIAEFTDYDVGLPEPPKEEQFGEIPF